MVSKRDDGQNVIQGTIDDVLRERVEKVVDNDDELSESRLVREGLKQVVPYYE